MKLQLPITPCVVNNEDYFKKLYLTNSAENHISSSCLQYLLSFLFVFGLVVSVTFVIEKELVKS